VSVRFDGDQPGLEGAYHFGVGGFGIAGAIIRATTGTGDHGPGLLYNDWDGPEDDAKEFRALVTQVPAAGVFKGYENGSFAFTGAPDGTHTGQYRLYVDGADLGLQSFSVVIGNSMSGSGAFQLGPLTQAATAALAVSGAASQALQPLAQSGAGQVGGAITGGGSWQLGELVQASAAAVGVAGTGAHSLAAFSQMAAGVVVSGLVGQGNVTLPAIQQAGQGTVSLSGAGAHSMVPLAHAAAGALSLAGASAAALAPIVQAATGVVGSLTVTGAGAQALGPLTQAATTVIAIVGQASQVLGMFTLQSAGLVGDYSVPGIPTRARLIAVRRTSRRIPVAPEPRTKMLPKFMNPGAELDWALDWRAPEEEGGPYLAPDDTVQSYTWELEGSLLTKLGEELEGDQTQIKLRMSSTAAAGQTCAAICSIVTAKGLRDSRRIVFEVGAS